MIFIVKLLSKVIRIMKIRALLFICCTTILVSAVEAKIKEDEGAPKQIVHIKRWISVFPN